MSKEDSNKPIDDGGCGDYCLCVREPHEEDKFKISENRLQNWEKWMRRREQIHDKLAGPLGRPVDELVMNVGDEYRNIQEDREIFYYTKLDTQFDKYRGNPEFWELPTALVNKCEGLRDPVYFTVKTKFEKNQIPPIEYVRNANYILNEKNVLSHTRKLYNLWRKSKYRNEQLKTLSYKVNLIEPHKPECDELVIVGEKICLTKEEDLIRKRRSTQHRFSEALSVKTNSFTVHEIPRLSFAINGIILAQDDELINNTVKIRLLFECSENLKVPVVEYLKFENKGLTTLRFYWNRIEKFRLFRNLTQSDREESQEFYFNKNELLLVPGKSLYFPIWFKAKKVGNYIQFWKITTLPKLWDDDFQLIILLQGIVRTEGFEEKSRNIKQMLEVRARTTLIKDLLRSMLENLKYTDTEPTTFVFTEKQIFESINQEIWWGAEKRSKYLYDKDIVNELKQFYQEVRQPNFPTNWNYSIRDLKIMTRKKDISDYVENETMQAKKARDRRIELNEEPNIEVQASPKKPAGPKEKATPKEKTAAPSPTPVVEQEEEGIFSIKETRCNALEDILHKLERPLMIENRDREKYFTVYIIMRTYLFKMCDALETLGNHSNYSIDDVDYRPTYQYNKVTSIDEIPERLIFERFDEIWLDGTKLIEPDTKIVDPVFPKPEILKNVPQDDAKLIYHTYFGIPIIDTTKKKGGKGDKKKAKEEKKTKDKKGKGDADKQKKKGEAKVTEPPKKVSTVKEGFDPYAEEYIPAETESIEELKSPSKDYVMRTEYNYSNYLIVYTHLIEAIDAMVDALETFNENVVSPETLGELKKCTSIYPEEDVPTDTKEEEEEEEVLIIEGSKVIVPTKKTEEDYSYFKYLLDSHLNKNINTKKYIVHGRMQQSDDPDQISIVSESIEKPDSRVNVFRSHETIVESIYPSGSVSVGVQMSDVDEEYEQFSNVLLDQSETTESDDTENTVGQILSHNIFYFMGDSDEEEKVEEEENQKSNE